MGKKALPLIIILILALTAGLSLLHTGLPPTHDGEYHVVRFIEFDKVLRAGTIYPRWAPDLNLGYGIPLFNYVYPLPNYLASFYHLLGISFIDSFKYIIFTGILFAGIFFFLWIKSIFDNRSALVGAVFYLFSPYFLVDAYIRGSVGEVLALALFPAFLWATTEYFKGDKKIYLPISAIFLALIIFSHNILALMFFPVCIIYSLILIASSKNKKAKVMRLALIILLGLTMSMVFWFPAIFEKAYAVGLAIFDYKSNFPEIYQLLFPSWGSGFFGGLAYDQMSVQIGIANLFALLMGVIAFVKLYRSKDDKNHLLGMFLLLIGIVVFLMLRISLPIWQSVPLMDYFQFPWRFLSLVILSCSFLAAGSAYVFKSRVFFLIMFLLPIILAYAYAHPAYFMDRTDNYYATRPNFIDGTNSIGNSFNTIWFKGKKIRPVSLTLVNDSVQIKAEERNPTKYNLITIASKSSSLTFNIAYFPGWTVRVDGKPTAGRHDSAGLVVVDVPKGKHVLNVDFQDTPIRAISTIISIISFILAITIFLRIFIMRRGFKNVILGMRR